jgi:hypothetical protein
MQAIRAIVDTYVRLRNEDALLAAKQQRLRVLAMCDANNPMFERLRSQCLEEIAEIEAGLERLRPAPLLPDPPPSPPQIEETSAPALPDPPPNPQQLEAAGDPALSLPANASTNAPAENDSRPLPTPIDPSPFLAVEGLPPADASAPSPTPAPSRSAPSSQPPQLLAAISPSLLASTILAGSISVKLQAGHAKPEAELLRLQAALRERMRSQG